MEWIRTDLKTKLLILEQKTILLLAKTLVKLYLPFLDAVSRSSYYYSNHNTFQGRIALHRIMHLGLSGKIVLVTGKRDLGRDNCQLPLRTILRRHKRHRTRHCRRLPRRRQHSTFLLANFRRSNKSTGRPPQTISTSRGPWQRT